MNLKRLYLDWQSTALGLVFGVGSFRDSCFVLRECPISLEERSSGWSVLFHRFLEKLSPHPHPREPQWVGPLA